MRSQLHPYVVPEWATSPTITAFLHQLGDTVQAGGYEREAIRPHVLGKFVDLLIAAERHPAMLQYHVRQASRLLSSRHNPP
jgi:uncharacterized protein (DUF1800 family)